MNLFKVLSFSAVTNLISKILGVILFALIAKVYIPIIGIEKYGLWLAISSFAQFLAVFDFGVGNTLANKISYVINRRLPKFYALIAVTILLLLITILLIFLINLTYAIFPNINILGLKSNFSLSEVNDNIKLYLTIFALNILPTALLKVYAGLQLSYVVNIFNILSYSISIIWIYLGNQSYYNTQYLIYQVGGVTLIINLLAGLLLFFYICSIRSLYKIRFNNLLIYINYFIKESKGFFVLQAGSIASYGLDGFVITNLLGPANFAVYAIAIKLFQFISLPLAIINSPLWHVYAENFSKNRISEIKRIRNISIFGSFIFSVIFGLLIIFYSDFFIYILGAGEINVGFLTLILFYFYTVIESTTNSYTMYLNGCSIIKIQVIATIIYLLLSIFFKVIFIQFNFFKLELIDVNYFIFVTLISYLISTPLFFIFFRKLYYRD